ncbi:MAG: hypothetical protein IKI75_04440 [Lachnospiraceae bacterium]|nr:hypothetical protein [Lachnospiraceae bacterium]
MKKHELNRLTALGMGIVFMAAAAGCGEEGASFRGSYEKEEDEEQPTATPTEAAAQAEPTEALPEPTEPDEPETVAEGIDLYQELSEWSFYFTSGAGGWGTGLEFEPDGSFSGDFHDSDMGVTGPGYPHGMITVCEFTGQLGEYTRVDDYTYRVKVDSLEYAPEGQENIEDDILYVTSTPYGLEDADELIIYLPGKPTAELDDAFMSWMRPTHFYQYVGSGFDYYEDIPEELPFCAVYNPGIDGYGFYGFANPGRNKMCLKNMAKLPGLKNWELTINDDGTYYCDDMDEYGFLRVQSAAVRLDDSFPSYSSDKEGAVRAVIEAVTGDHGIESLYVPDDDYMDLSLAYISGEPVQYEAWESGYEEDTMECQGIFHFDYEYASDGSTSGGYAQAYIVSADPEDENGRYEFLNQYLHSLALTGNYEGLSSESADNGERWIIAEVAACNPVAGTVEADEVVWISGDDEETLEEYGIDPDDVSNDYAIGGVDGDYVSYKLSDDCPIYLRFVENIFHRYISLEDLDANIRDMDEFNQQFYADNPEANEEKYTILFCMLLDENDQVVAMYEPYRP